MTLSRRQRLSDTLHLIADTIQEAENQLASLPPLSEAFLPPRRKRSKSGTFEPHRASAADLGARRMRERLNPPSNRVLRAKRERDARNRHHALKDLVAPPRKVLGSRLRAR